jgi:hypothetical protein
VLRIARESVGKRAQNKHETSDESGGSRRASISSNIPKNKNEKLAYLFRMVIGQGLVKGATSAHHPYKRRKRRERNGKDTM